MYTTSHLNIPRNTTILIKLVTCQKMMPLFTKQIAEQKTYNLHHKETIIYFSIIQFKLSLHYSFIVRHM